MEDEDLFPIILYLVFLGLIITVDITLWQHFGKRITVPIIGLEIYIIFFTKVGKKIEEIIDFLGKGLCALFAGATLLFVLYLFFKWFITWYLN